MRSAFESQDMAAHHSFKAAGLERQLETSIYSDDSDAVEALEARIAELELERGLMKMENAAYKKGDEAFAAAAGITVEQAAARRVKIEQGYSWCRKPHPSYELQNLGGNISRLRKRLEFVKSQQERVARAEAATDGVLIEGDVLGNGHGYVTVTFDEKPERSILNALREAGFRWGQGSWGGNLSQLPEALKQYLPEGTPTPIQEPAADEVAAPAPAPAFEPLDTTNPPEWAKAMIVAELEHDESDAMTDYHATRTSKFVPLAWSKHTTDRFDEMRKAAARFPETAHLGPGLGLFTVWVAALEDIVSNGSAIWRGSRSPWHRDISPEEPFTTRAAAEAFIAETGTPHEIDVDGVVKRFGWQITEETVEHREKYSMGHGYYLKASGRYSSGWIVRKSGLPKGGQS
jgi:hypothetical protein